MLNLFKHIKFFCWVFFVFSLKHIGLMLYGYFKYSIWYWADDAFVDILRVSIIVFAAILVRKFIDYFLFRKK